MVVFQNGNDRHFGIVRRFGCQPLFLVPVISIPAKIITKTLVDTPQQLLTAFPAKPLGFIPYFFFLTIATKTIIRSV